MSSTCVKTSSYSFFRHSYVNNILLQTWSTHTHSVFKCVEVIDASLIHTLLNDASNLVAIVTWFKSGLSQITSDEVRVLYCSSWTVSRARDVGRRVITVCQILLSFFNKPAIINEYTAISRACQPGCSGVVYFETQSYTEFLARYMVDFIVTYKLTRPTSDLHRSLKLPVLRP